MTGHGAFPLFPDFPWIRSCHISDEMLNYVMLIKRGMHLKRWEGRERGNEYDTAAVMRMEINGLWEVRNPSGKIIFQGDILADAPLFGISKSCSHALNLQANFCQPDAKRLIL